MRPLPRYVYSEKDVPGEPALVDGWAEYYVGPERTFYGEIRLEMF